MPRKNKPSQGGKQKPQKSQKNPTRRRPAQRRTPFADAGQALGEYIHPAAAQLGRGVGALFGSVIGRGDYKSDAPVVTNQTPVFSSGSNGEVTITHREYITDIATAGSTFASGTFPINPGLRSTFPWLANVASNFECYEFEGLLFHFKTSSGTAVGSTNTALGVVILATNYDSLDVPFSSKQQMEAYQFCSSSITSESVLHPVECKRKLNVLGPAYVRMGSPPAGADLRMYDLGLFQIATQGQQAVANVGELWVTYRVKLMKPKIDVPIGANLRAATYTCTYSGADSLISLAPNAGNNLTLTRTGTGVFSVPFAGRYRLTWYVQAATSVASLILPAAASNATLITLRTAGFITSSQLQHVAIFDILAPNGSISLGTLSVSGAPVTAILTLDQIPSNITQ